MWMPTAFLFGGSNDHFPSGRYLSPCVSASYAVVCDACTPHRVALPQVRTSALNIVLHVLSVQDPGVTAFLALEENHGGFFHQMSYLMQDAYSQILCRVSGWKKSRPPAPPPPRDAMS